MKQESTPEEKAIRDGKVAKLKAVWDSILTGADLKGQTRLANESYEDFHDRRYIENTWTKSHLKGKIAWLSTNLEWNEDMKRHFNRGAGSYRKSSFGELKYSDD